MVMIKNVIKIQNGEIMVFDEYGEQIPEYQGHCDGVRESILRDAPPDAVFSHWFGDDAEPRIISREEW